MKSGIFILVINIIIMFTTNCSIIDGAKKNDPLQNIELELVAKDEQGIEKSIFDNGSNIALGLKAINNSENEIELTDFNYCELYNYDDFLLLYKVVNSTELGERELVPLGKPYNSPINCPDINLPSRKIPAYGEIYITGNYWDENQNNKTLSVGVYYSSFTYKLNQNDQSKIFNIEIEFEIK